MIVLGVRSQSRAPAPIADSVQERKGIIVQPLLNNGSKQKVHRVLLSVLPW